MRARQLRRIYRVPSKVGNDFCSLASANEVAGSKQRIAAIYIFVNIYSIYTKPIQSAVICYCSAGAKLSAIILGSGSFARFDEANKQ